MHISFPSARRYALVDSKSDKHDQIEHPVLELILALFFVSERKMPLLGPQYT